MYAETVYTHTDTLDGPLPFVSIDETRASKQIRNTFISLPKDRIGSIIEQRRYHT